VPANPTGQVYNGNGGFLIPTSNGQETSLFIFSGEGGNIAAWAKDSGATAVTSYDDEVDNGTDHAVYKGLALSMVMAQVTSTRPTCITIKSTYSIPTSPNQRVCSAGARPSIVFYTPLPTIGASRSGERVPSTLSGRIGAAAIGKQSSYGPIRFVLPQFPSNIKSGNLRLDF
jgi:hypothetical protein